MVIPSLANQDLTSMLMASLCFRDGRTETVRPCTVESKNFVLAMSDEKSTVGAGNQLDSSFFKELQL